MSTLHETTLHGPVERTVPAAWAQSPGHSVVRAVAVQSARVLGCALALAVLVYAGLAAAQQLPTALGIVLGWLLISFVAAPVVGFLLKALTAENTAPVVSGPHRGPDGHEPSGSTRG